ncbi:SOS response-associated peptidase [Georgenia faecalis]|uniref:Abasic site processing protein n=1 Tax=Georgenia faecalis TaxID=2483799 RepID=A0ABV9D6F5_9MICO|nr:SOS response-associated peptidase [Georgenia faecalis]
MCGRYASFRQAQDLADTFDVAEVTDEAAAVPPSFNVAPTQPVRIVLERLVEAEPLTVRREMHAARWGLVPAWAKDPSVGARMINARTETVAEKSVFAKPLATRRCVLLADGYFEWRRDAGRKIPYFVHGADAGPVALAGLYSFWRDPAKAEDDPTRWLLSTTVLTRAARPELEFLHDREPVLLAPGILADWLDPALTAPEGALAVLHAEAPRVDLHEVGAKVGNVRNDSPELIEPVDA